jgi:putative nucleotidyltransferase with HDIG domain
MVTPQSFSDDPLRVMRAVRLAAELSFTVEPDTEAAARRSSPDLARTPGERIFTELRRIVAGPAALPGLALLDAFGVVAVILPELSALSGVGQSVYHHLDVHGHTLEALGALIALAEDPGSVFGPKLGERVAAFLREPFADELTRGGALRFGTLLHDIAKPQTRAETTEGRVTFMGHDAAGAELGHAILTRLRASERLAGYVAALTRHHLRLGFLVHAAPLDRRAVYRYLAGCEPVAVDVTLMSVADRQATRGRGAAEAIGAHLQLATAVLPAALDWHRRRPRPPIRGDRLAQAVGLTPGPALGELLEELTAAAYAGEIAGEAQAIEYARRRLAR